MLEFHIIKVLIIFHNSHIVVHAQAFYSWMAKYVTVYLIYKFTMTSNTYKILVDIRTVV